MQINLRSWPNVAARKLYSATHLGNELQQNLMQKLSYFLLSKVLPGLLWFGLEPDGIPTKSIVIRKVQGHTTR